MKAQDAQDSSSVEDDDGFAAQARRRLDRLRATIGDVASHSGLNRDTVSAVLHGRGSTRSQGKVDDALTSMEEEAGLPPIEDEGHVEPQLPVVDQQAVPMIRFTVEGVYGAKALIVEAPPENLAELEAAVDRIMRRLQQGQQPPRPGESG